jgi:glycosyltransferase involved in cell wall biosynthesis
MIKSNSQKACQPKILVVNSDMTSHGGIASVIQTLYRENELQGKPVEYLLLKTSYYKDKSKAAEVLLLIGSLFRFIFILTFSPVDIVHIHSSAWLSFYRKSIFFFLAKCFRKKIIFHLHSSQFDEFFLSTDFFKSKLICFVFKHSDLIVTLCNEWEKKIKRQYGNVNVLTVHNPISMKEYGESDLRSMNSGRLRILFLAFLIQSKGLEDIVILARKIKDSGIKNIEVVIAGKGELEGWLIKAIMEYGLSDIINFKGWVEGENKKEMLRSADVYFLPSYNEGMPISILEAMCNSLAIVATRIAGVPDLVEEGINGYMMTPGDIEGYFNIFTDLAANPQKVCDMGKESYRLVQGFDSSIILQKLFAIYERLILDRPV